MIDEKKLEEWKSHLHGMGWYQLDADTILNLVNSYTASLRVVRAAQKIVISKSADKTREEIDGNVLIEIYEALKPFSSPGGKEASGD